MTLPIRPRTVPCTRCGIHPAPAPTSLDIDPLCFACQETLAVAYGSDLRASKGCPSWGVDEDCGGPLMPGSDLCGDCHMARCDAESPRIPH